MGGRRAEKARSPLRVWPAASSTAVLSAGVLIGQLSLPGWLGVAGVARGGLDSAVALLQTIAGSVITVMASTVTLTVVALQTGQ